MILLNQFQDNQTYMTHGKAKIVYRDCITRLHVMGRPGKGAGGLTMIKHKFTVILGNGMPLIQQYLFVLSMNKPVKRIYVIFHKWQLSLQKIISQKKLHLCMTCLTAFNFCQVDYINTEYSETIET